MLGARLTAAASGVVQCTIGVLYLPQLPDELIRRPLQPGQVSAVVYIESFGPLWSIMFIVSGLFLIAAVVRRKGFIFGHIASAGVWAMYGSSILYSAILTEPPVPVVAGTIAVGIAITNITLAIGCRERGLS